MRWIYSELFTPKAAQQFAALEDPPAPAPDRVARGISLEGLIENSAEVEGLLSGLDGWSGLLRASGLSLQEQSVWNLLYTRSESEIKEALGLRDLGQPISRGPASSKTAGSHLRFFLLATTRSLMPIEIPTTNPLCVTARYPARA